MLLAYVNAFYVNIFSDKKNSAWKGNCKNIFLKKINKFPSQGTRGREKG